MNIRLGLERISAVWWGMWALFAAITALVILIGDRDPTGLAFFLLLIPVYLLHRLTCWVIAGFFTARG